MPLQKLVPRSRKAAYLMVIALILGGAIPAGIVGAVVAPLISHNATTAEDAAQGAADAKRAAADARRAARQSTELSCQIGALLVGAPVVQQPDQSHREFIQDIRTVTAMLRSLKETNCEGVKGVSITSVGIRRQLHKFRDVLPHSGKSSPAPNTSSTSPGSSGAPAPDGSSPPQAPAPSGGSPPPSGGPPGGDGGGPPPNPPAPPPGGGGPPPNPGPPEPAPGPVDRITDMVCQIDAFGVRVCIRR